MRDTSTPNLITKASIRKLDALKLDAEKTHRTVARLHCYEVNAQLNGLLTKLMRASNKEDSKALIATARFMFAKDLFGDNCTGGFDYFNTCTLDAFHFYIKSVLTYFEKELAKTDNPTYDDAYNAFDSATKRALRITKCFFDRREFGFEKEKVYIPSIATAKNRKMIIDYLDPDQYFDFDIENSETELEYDMHQAEFTNESSKRGNLETGFRDDNGRPYSIDPETDEIIYDEEETESV